MQIEIGSVRFEADGQSCYAKLGRWGFYAGRDSGLFGDPDGRFEVRREGGSVCVWCFGLFVIVSPPQSDDGGGIIRPMAFSPAV